jgi:hypothetical protein
MIEFIFEVIVQAIFESLPNLIGIGTKWLFYLGKKPISEIKKENWNTRIGFIVFILLILFIVYLAN